ncbi:MAG: hypothetical protein OSJ65_06280 [Bacilli bacterium]|nr:hypothetical protein [Bacilli bacterium]
MKKSKYALLSIISLFIVILGVVGISILFSMSKNDIKHLEVRNNSKFEEATTTEAPKLCEPNTGVYYTVNAGGAIIYDKANDTANNVGSYSAGTKVTVFCTENGRGRVNKNSNEYVKLSDLTELSVSVTPTLTHPNYDYLFRNENFVLNLILSAPNIPDDGAARLSFKITKGTEDTTSQFSFSTGNFSNGSQTITITNSTAQEGTYTITPYVDGHPKTTEDFIVEKNKLIFDINAPSSSPTEIHENERGTWTSSLSSNRIPSTLTFDDFNIEIKKNGVDCKSKFEVTTNGANITITNKERKIVYKDGQWKDDTSDYASAGTYTITITIKDMNTYSTVYGSSKSKNFEILPKKTEITEDSANRSRGRYNIKITKPSYNLQIVGTITHNGLTKYVLNEKKNGAAATEFSLYAYSEAELLEIYPRLSLKDIYFFDRITVSKPGIKDKDGNTTNVSAVHPVAINYQDSVIIVKYINTGTAEEKKITFYEGFSNTEKVMTEANFKNEYKSAFNALTVKKPAGKSFEKDTGNIFFARTVAKVKKEITTDMELEPLANTGGEVTYKINFSGFLQNELNNFYTSLTDSDGKIMVGRDSNGNMVQSDGNFELITDRSAIESGQFAVTLKYIGKENKYEGDYTVKFWIGNTVYTTEFTLGSGPEDYIIFSELDRDELSGNPLKGNNPPSNQKYEYKIGMYLKKSKQDSYDVDLSKIDYKVYDKRIGIYSGNDSNTRYYFYDEEEYITKINKLLNGYVYFELWDEAGNVIKKEQAMSESNFAATYSEAAECLNDLVFDKTTGLLTGDAIQNNTGSAAVGMHPVRIIDNNVSDEDEENNSGDEDDTGTKEDGQIVYKNNRNEIKTEYFSEAFKTKNENQKAFSRKVQSRFVFIDTDPDTEGREYQLGALKGMRQINIDNKNGQGYTLADIQSHDKTDSFYIRTAERLYTDDNYTGEYIPTEKDIENEQKEIAKSTLTVRPRSEVVPGEYYIYVIHGKTSAIGYSYTEVFGAKDPITKKPVEYPIELALNPEAYNRNIHMTSFQYTSPVYSMSINPPEESNTKNDLKLAYANVDSTISFDVTLNYIYDKTGLTYTIEYYNGTTWEDVTKSNYFGINNAILPTEALDNSGSNFETKGLVPSKFDLRTVPGTTKIGRYRIKFDYSNNGVSMPTTEQEFTIKANYYDINIIPTEVQKVTSEGRKPFDLIYTTQHTTTEIPINLSYVTNPDALEFELKYVPSGTVNPWQPSNSQFNSYADANTVIFKYTKQITPVSGSNHESVYLLSLINADGETLTKPPEGEYVLKVRYREQYADGVDDEGNPLYKYNAEATTSYTFTVSEPEKYFTVVGKSEKAVARQNEMYYTQSIISNYVNGLILKGKTISYAIEMHEPGGDSYENVSSNSSRLKLFDINMQWDVDDVIDRINYTGNLKVNLNVDKIDKIFEVNDSPIGQFLFIINIDQERFEINMPNLRELFEWNIENVDISATLDNNGETINVKEYYSNINPTITVDLKTIHEENAKYAITNVCTSEETCSPSEDMINFNDRFDLVSIVPNQIVVKQKTNLSEETRLPKGKYQFVAYYSKEDYDVHEFIVRDEYAEISIGNINIETPLKDEVSNQLFVNKNSKITIPVTVIGVPYENVTVDFTNADQTENYNHLFPYDRNKFLTDHVIELNYDHNNSIPAQDYMVIIHKVVNEDLIEDHKILKFNDSYFNYIISNVTYNPNPAVPNYDNGGEIIFDITTDEWMTGSALDDNEMKQNFVDNLKIYHADKEEDLSSKFEITYKNTSSITDFKVVLRYSKEKEILPGDYRAEFSAAKGKFILAKSKNFIVGDYERKLTITGVSLESETPDGLIHKNTGGSYILSYTSNYEIDTNNLFIKVTNQEKQDVTNKFTFEKNEEGKVKVKFDPNIHTIDYGKYIITLTYADPVTHGNNVNTTEVIMYGDYKNIIIKDIRSNVTPILAENENQYYEFTLDISNLTEDEKNLAKIRIYDAENNIVASTINSDKVENAFDVIKVGTDKYNINILPYKARVGSYYAEIIIPASYDPNNEGLQNISNRLAFTVDDTLYEVNLKASSYLTTAEKINGTFDIYDYIGVTGSYDFASNSPYKDEYSIKVFNKLKLVKEISVEAGLKNGYDNLAFTVDEISNGYVEVALCIKGLPYASITKNVLEYIKITEFAVILDNRDVGDELILNQGDKKTFELFIRPENATNKNLVFESSDEDVATFKGNTITVIDTGSAEITVKNKEVSKTFTLNISELVQSDVYEVDQDERTIFVSSLNKKIMSKEEFIGNLLYLRDDYRILDGSNHDVTDTTNVVGTGYKIVSGNITYTAIVIGDVNGSGTIDLGDATSTFRCYRNYTKLTGVYLKAATLSRGNNVQLGDATKLFRFYRGYVNEI